MTGAVTMFSTLITFLFRPNPRSEAVARLGQMTDRELADLGIGRSEIRTFVDERAAD